MSLVPPNRYWERPFWPARRQAGTAVPGQVVDVHSEQNGAIYQEITFGWGDVAPVGLLAKDRADTLECRINGKHGDHSSHLHPQAYRQECLR